MPEFTSRPQQYPLIGALGRALGTADQFARKPFGYSNPPVEIISDLLQIPALARTAENINYGSPLTQGTGQARRLTKDTTGAIEGALNLAPLAGPAMKATKGRPIGLMVKAEGNLNLRPSVIAENLKGPDKQKVGDFLKQVGAMKGLTKEGKQMATAKLQAMSPDEVVTKQFIEDSFEPSKYNVVDLKGAAPDAYEHYYGEALDQLLNEKSFWQAIGEEMGLSADSDAWKQLQQLYKKVDRGVVYGNTRSLSPEVKATLDELGIIDSGKVDGMLFEQWLDGPLHDQAGKRAEELVQQYGATRDEYVYRDFQRLYPEADYLPEELAGEYVEFGVAHPDAPGTYKHYEYASDPLTAHVRGTSKAEYALLPDSTDINLDPNSFLIEELQSDAAKTAGSAGVLHQPHATAFKAAVQKALELGNDTVYLPSAQTISSVRGKGTESFAPIYDQEVINYGVGPLSRIEGVTVEPVMFDDIEGPSVAYHKIKIGPEAKTEILEGKGQSLPGFAGGGKVDKQEFRATPRSGALGTIADATKKLHDNYLKAQAGYANPVTETISNLLGIPAFADMMDRMSYGEPLTKGRGETLQLKPWAVEGLASLPAGVATETSLRVIKSLPGALKHASQEFAKASVAGAPHVIKPKGAQTITEHVQKELSNLRFGQNPEAQLATLEERLAEGVSPEFRELYETSINSLKKDAALKKWIDSTLRKYVIRDMGTPDDPLVKLADEGITHSPYMRDMAEEYQFDSPTSPFFAREREKLGFPKEGVATTPLGKVVETQLDYATGIPFKNTTDVGQGVTARNRVGLDIPEWTQKLDPETNLYAPSPAGLEFMHMLDVLADDLATGRIRPDQMSKISMEQAVRRTQQYDDELAAKMNVEKAAARAGLPVHREYNSGFRWIELNQPGSFAAESDAMGHSVRGYEPPKGHPDWVEASGKSGHESYGHGGWEAIKSGRAKVYSLVDDKGQPHATVEVKIPQNAQAAIGSLNAQEREALRQEVANAHFGGRLYTAKNMDEFFELEKKAFAEKYGVKPQITQIKGKQNTAPAPDYQPYVADFVRQGDWFHNVGDLDYTDLVRIGDKMMRQPELQQVLELGDTRIPRATIDWYNRAMQMEPHKLSELDAAKLEAIRSFTPPEMKAGGGVDFGKLLSEAVNKYSQPAMAEGGTVDVEQLRAAYFGG
jgi:hypothetical protein